MSVPPPGLWHKDYLPAWGLWSKSRVRVRFLCLWCKSTSLAMFWPRIHVTGEKLWRPACLWPMSLEPLGCFWNPLERVPEGSRGFQVQRVPEGSKSRGCQEPSGPGGSWHPLWSSGGSMGPWNPLVSAPGTPYY